jgi:hypothetical protein
MTFHLNAWSWYWLGWLLAFIVPELYNVFTDPPGTLSETVWAIENLNTSQAFDFGMWTDVHWVVAGIVWGLFLWLSLHLPFGLLG